MNLINLAQNGLSAAQSALNVVGNNLTNATTEGYSRQNIMLGEAGGKSTQYGFFGYGVKVDGVQRAYDGFVSNQVRGAATEFSALNSRYEQASQIDDMLGDSTNNVSVTLDGTFKAMEAVSKDPVDPAARQGVLSEFKALSYQFQSNSDTLENLEKGTNTQISQTVDDINSYTSQLATLNQEIEKVHGQTGGLPDDLLDQRDQLLSKLNDDIGIRVNENSDTGRVDVSLKNGMALVYGDTSCQLQASVSEENSGKTVVSYIDATGNALRLDEDKTTEGKLGGLFKFRNTDLVDAKNQLNQLALQLANKFNTVNAQGYDRNGEQGGDIFNVAAPSAQANTKNKGDATLDISLSDVTHVQPDDYTLVYKGPSATDWSVTTRDGRTVEPDIGDNGELTFDGVTVKPDGTAEPGDSFRVNPVEGAAGSLSVAITDGDQIAAAKSSDTTDQSDNENIKELIDIKNENVVGNKTLTGAYASLVSSVGSSVNGLKSDLDTSSKVCDEWNLQKQSVSGVNITEEYVNLNMYTQYYQANAQVLQTASTLFDTILNIK